MRLGNRHSLPESLNGSLSYAEDLLSDPIALFRVIRSNSQVKLALYAAGNLDQGAGRPRISGHWVLMYLAYLTSGRRDVRRWYNAVPLRVWRSAGFMDLPSYHATYRNFIALESRSEEILEVTKILIRWAVKHSGGKVGFDLHIDGTEAETNARLLHDCDAGRCPRITDWKGPKKVVYPAAPKVSTDDARQARWDDEKKAPEQVEEPIVERRGKRFKTANGCWWKTSDPDAGIRGYDYRRFWHGYYHLKVIDHYTGAVVASLMTNASVNEHKSYDQLLDLAMEMTGFAPRAMVADAGFAVSDVYETNSKEGIATVAPYRTGGKNSERKNHDKFDMYGIPRCKYCGAPGKFVRFNPHPKPRVWFECSAPARDDCHRSQSIRCEEKWRYLLPLWRNTEAYLALRDSHSNLERRHKDWREDFLVAGNNSSNRPLRRGIACQQLRSVMAHFVEWVGVCYREGWLGEKAGKRINQAKSVIADYKAELEKFIRRSIIGKGLHLPLSRSEKYVEQVAVGIKGRGDPVDTS